MLRPRDFLLTLAVIACLAWLGKPAPVRCRLRPSKPVEIQILLSIAQERLRALGGNNSITSQDGDLMASFANPQELQRCRPLLTATGRIQLLTTFFDPRTGKMQEFDWLQYLGTDTLCNQHPPNHRSKGWLVYSVLPTRQGLSIELNVCKECRGHNGTERDLTFCLDGLPCGKATMEHNLSQCPEPPPPGCTRNRITVIGLSPDLAQEIASLLQSGPYPVPLSQI